MRSTRQRTTDTVYNFDRWRVLGTRGHYMATYRLFNGVAHWELYYTPTPKAAPQFVEEVHGINDQFAIKLKAFYNDHPELKKIRTPVASRTGKYVVLWGLTH